MMSIGFLREVPKKHGAFSPSVSELAFRIATRSRFSNPWNEGPQYYAGRERGSFQILCSRSGSSTSVAFRFCIHGHAKSSHGRKQSCDERERQYREFQAGLCDEDGSGSRENAASFERIPPAQYASRRSGPSGRCGFQVFCCQSMRRSPIRATSDDTPKVCAILAGPLKRQIGPVATNHFSRKPCQTYSRASGRVWSLVAWSTWPAFFAKRNW